MILLQQPLQLVNDSIPSAREEIAMLKSMPLDDFLDQAVQALVKFSINLAIALFVFYVGRLIIRKIFKVLQTIMTRRQVDRSLATFVQSMVKMVLYFILIIIVVGILGIETSSFIALFASAGVAIGMALSGTLQNFAGGVLILLLKPYKVGDYIEAQGYAGYVTEIQIFHTIISTYDNKSIIIPNGGLSTGSINNWSREEYRRIEWAVSISYGDDVALARKTIMDIFASDDRIVKLYLEDDRQSRGISDECADSPDPEACEEELQQKKPSLLGRMFHHKVKSKVSALNQRVARRMEVPPVKIERPPSVSLDSMGDSGVNLKARAWARSEFYWPLYYEINERIYNELPRAGINFPFPQMDVHLTDTPSKDN